MVGARGSGGIYTGSQPMKMEPIEGSETSEIINQMPGNYPKGNLLYSVHGEILKSRIISPLLKLLYENCKHALSYTADFLKLNSSICFLHVNNRKTASIQGQNMLS